MDGARGRVGVVERRLAAAALLIAFAMTAMTLLGGLSSWQYYLTVEECQASSATLAGRRLRVNGVIAPNTLSIRADRSLAVFTLVGRGGGLPVSCRGPLPDNLSESVQVVVEGELAASGRLCGERVMTRCASKYESATAKGQAAGVAYTAGPLP
jgi:cytochrome c-type biogenesis protein CcmE